jgi:hypothetical protein
VNKKSSQEAFKLRLFVSYAAEDQELVKLFTDALGRQLSHYVDVYVDFRSVLVGTNLIRDIFANGISRSHLIVAFWSKYAVESRWVRYEILLTRMLGKILIPVVMDTQAEKSLDLGFTRLDSEKYYVGYKSNDSNQMISGLVALVEEWFNKFRVYNYFARYITRFSSGPVEDEFYEFAQELLEQDNRYLLFKAGTPALLLRDETFTPNRMEYLERLIRTYSIERSSSKGIYLFDYRKTHHRLVGANRENLREFAKGVLVKLDHSRIDVDGLKSRQFVSYLPSGIWGENKGCLILREPVHGEFAGLVFLKGRELNTVRSFYLNLISGTNIMDYRCWGNKLLQS